MQMLHSADMKIQSHGFASSAYARSRTGTICTIRNCRRCCIGAEQTLRVHSPGGSIFLREMT